MRAFWSDKQNCSHNVLQKVQKPGDHPNFRKNALGAKRPFSELWESSGAFTEKRSRSSGKRFSEFKLLGMGSHDLSNTKTKILGATPGAIPGIDGNPHERFSFAPAPLQKCVGDFCSINFGGFCREFSWRIFLGTFSHRNEERKSGDKIRKKIRRLKNKNPRKIRSAKIRS